MSIADVKYKQLIQEILDNGEWDTGGEVRPTYKDGTAAHSKSIFGYQVKFEQGENPIITCKHVPVKSSINEVVHLFWRLKSTSKKDMHDLGIKYWDEWLLKDDTIGRSYSYQLANQKHRIDTDNGAKYLDQVDYVLHELEHNPYSRRIMANYWHPKDDEYKALKECVYGYQFNVRNNTLDMIVTQRSCDTLLGVPSNWIGNYALQCTLANLFNYEVGTFTHQMGNVHLYDNQIELAKKLLDEPEYEQPTICVNPSVRSFYDYTVDDIKVINYKHGKKFKSEVAI